MGPRKLNTELLLDAGKIAIAAIVAAVATLSSGLLIPDQTQSATCAQVFENAAAFRGTSPELDALVGDATAACLLDLLEDLEND